MKTKNTVLFRSFISLLTLLPIAPSYANVYVYQGNNGSEIVTNKIKKDKGYSLKYIHTNNSEQQKAPTSRTEPLRGKDQKTCSLQGLDAKSSREKTNILKGFCPNQTKNLPHAAISAKALNDVITIRSCDHDAGAICSLEWKNKEFIDDYDHGRQLQSASSFDNLGEDFNPTEAGGSIFHYGPNPSDGKSILLARNTDKNVLATYSQMAFWNPVNGVRTSGHTLTKQVTIGYEGLDNVIEYLSQFTIPEGEIHENGVFEAVTAYMPREFSTFWTYHHVSETLTPYQPLHYGNMNEQHLPIIASTADQQFALGVYSPDSPQPAFPTVGYGGFLLDGLFPKWNNVFRVENPKGDLHFRSYVVFGTLDDVKRSIAILHEKF